MGVTDEVLAVSGWFAVGAQAEIISKSEIPINLCMHIPFIGKNNYKKDYN